MLFSPYRDPAARRSVWSCIAVVKSRLRSWQHSGRRLSGISAEWRTCNRSELPLYSGGLYGYGERVAGGNRLADGQTTVAHYPAAERPLLDEIRRIVPA